MNDNFTEVTQRVFEFYSRLCPNVKLAAHICSSSYMHEGRIIREGEFVARVVVVNSQDQTICVLAERVDSSPNAALNRLFDSCDGPIFQATSKLGPVTTEFRDLVVVVLPKAGTRDYANHSDQVDSVRASIEELFATLSAR